MKSLKVYWLVFQPILLIKDLSFFLGFALLTLLGGFTIPSIDFYNFISRIIFFNAIGFPFIYITLGGVIFINIFLIRSTLIDCYALRTQSFVASFLIFVTFTILAFLGFWSRVNLEFTTPSADVLLGTSLQQISRQLPPSILPIVTTVLFTVSIFGVAYSVAYGSYAKTDYSSFKFWIDKIISIIDTTQDVDYKQVLKNVENVVAALNQVIPYESRHYGKFIQMSVLTPLLEIQKFIEQEVQTQPQLLFELSRSSPMHEQFKAVHKAYQDMHLLLKVG